MKAESLLRLAKEVFSHLGVDTPEMGAIELEQRSGGGSLIAATALEDVRIASPCPGDWNEMVGGEQVRHRASRELNVHDVSEMTREEAEGLINKEGGRVCIDFPTFEFCIRNGKNNLRAEEYDLANEMLSRSDIVTIAKGIFEPGIIIR